MGLRVHRDTYEQIVGGPCRDQSSNVHVLFVANGLLHYLLYQAFPSISPQTPQQIHRPVRHGTRVQLLPDGHEKKAVSVRPAEAKQQGLTVGVDNQVNYRGVRRRRISCRAHVGVCCGRASGWKQWGGGDSLFLVGEGEAFGVCVSVLQRVARRLGGSAFALSLCSMLALSFISVPFSFSRGQTFTPSITQSHRCRSTSCLAFRPRSGRRWKAKIAVSSVRRTSWTSAFSSVPRARETPPKPCVMFKRETPSLLTQWVVRLLYFLASKGFVAWEVSLFSDTHTYRGGDSDWSNFGWTMAGKRT